MMFEKKNFEEPICFINPLTDFGFKRLFANDGCQKELMHMLNLFVSKQLGLITDLQYLPNEAIGFGELSHKVIFDVLCKNQNGDYIVVEMQKSRQQLPIDRGVAYASRLISNGITINEGKYLISKVCVVCIMEQPDRLALKRNEEVWHAQLRDEYGNIISDNPTFCMVELGIFARKNIVPKTEQELLMHVFNNMPTMTCLPQAAIGNPFFETMFRRCKYQNFSVMEKEEYKRSIYDYPDVQGVIAFTKQEAFADGVDAGKAEGKAEGIAEGKAKNNLEIALKMLAEGLDMALICKITGLTEKEIKSQH